MEDGIDRGLGGRAKPFNVLVTCAGRRNYLIRDLQTALGGDGKVFAADASADAPALHVADRAFTVPPIGESESIEAILDICSTADVALVLSLNDFELPLFAEHRHEFMEVGAIPVVSSRRVIDLCYDKWETARFLRAWGLNSPACFLSESRAKQALASGAMSYPVIVKPRWGTASIAVETAFNEDEFACAFRHVEVMLSRSGLVAHMPKATTAGVLVQEMVPGQEFGVDVVNDLRGRYATTLARRKLSMRSGETDRATTVNDALFDDLGKKIAGCLQHVGPLDCDVFLHDGVLTVLEMNPRFGGGYPFSAAPRGANVPAALVAWARSEVPRASWLRQHAGVTSSKYDDMIVVGSEAAGREC